MVRVSALLCVLLLLAGCGSTQSAPPASTPSSAASGGAAPSKTTPAPSASKGSPTSSTSTAPAQTSASAVLPEAAVQTTPLKPTKVIGPTKSQTAIRAALRGSGTDRLYIQGASSGDGTLMVQGASGTQIWSVPHIGLVSVLTFGSAHLPVIVAQSSPTMCGSGGCSYATYTYDPGQSSFVAIPPPAVTGYAWNASQSAFQPGPLPSAPALGAFFGFAKPNAQGVLFENRLYDLWQHSEAIQYQYATTPSGPGAWVAAGPPTYTPTGASAAQFTDAGQAFLGLLQARALNLPKQGLSLLPKGAAGQSLWQALAPLGALGPSLNWGPSDPTVTPQGGTAHIRATVFGTSGSGPSEALVAYTIDAQATTGSSPKITSVSLTPITNTLGTVSALLEDVRSQSSLQQSLSSTSGMLDVGVSGPSTWTLQWVSAQNITPWITVNAQSGTVAKAPSTP